MRFHTKRRGPDHILAWHSSYETVRLLTPIREIMFAHHRSRIQGRGHAVRVWLGTKNAQ